MDFKESKILLYLLAFIVLPEMLSAQVPGWLPPQSQSFKYNATVIAEIELSEIPSYNLNDSIAFFVGTDIRGLGKSIDTGNGKILHFITIYSNQGVDTMQIGVLHRNTSTVYEVNQPFVFKAQGIYGSLSNPLKVKIYPENNAPFSINTVPDQTTMETVPFEPIDMNNYLNQPDSNEVSWITVYNPNLIAYFEGSVLHVSGVNGFIGQTQLTVKASEISSRLEERGNYETDRNVSQNQEAEITIQFIVTPLLQAPLWQPKIPGQSIVQGTQFQLTELAEYENQYNGPSIRYDYRPVITPSFDPQPRPIWNLDIRYGINMTVAAKVQFTPKYQFHHNDDLLAAFVGDTLRGVAHLDSSTGLYFLTVGGFTSDEDSVTLKFYSGEMQYTLTHRIPLQYRPYGIVGNLSMPYIIDFAPILPIIPDTPIIGGVYAMPIEIVDSAFLGSVDFTFIAEDPVYPEVLHDESIATFCIVQDSSELFTLYQDADGDGFGNPEISIVACISTAGYVDNGDDCDDTNPEDPNTTISKIEDSAWQNDDGYICKGDRVVLVAMGAQSYIWQDGSTNADTIVSPLSTTTYKVTVTHVSGCKGLKTVTVFIEGKVVKNEDDNGFGTLRDVLLCVEDGDTITFDQPTIDESQLISPLLVDKNVMISGWSSFRPIIYFNHALSNGSIILSNNKKLTLDNIDIKLINANNKNVFEGDGKVDIISITKLY